MSRRLVFGALSRSRLRGLTPLGIVDGLPVFPIRCAEDDNSADSSGDDTDDDAQDVDDDDHDDDDDSDDNAKDDDKNKRRRPRNARTSEFNRIKRENARLAREARERQAKDREAELANKSEVERAAAERDDAVKERDELRTRMSSVAVELEIIKASNGKFSWVDLEDVLNDRTLRSSIEVGDDGEITGVKEALRDLAKRKPHYLAKSDQDDGKNGNGRASNGTNGTGTGASNSGSGKSGGQPNSGSNGNNLAADRERLNMVYPALGRLPQ